MKYGISISPPKPFTFEDLNINEIFRDYLHYLHFLCYYYSVSVALILNKMILHEMRQIRRISYSFIQVLTS